ncbi:retrovirus-related pol polyprotein from transposon TNT 1-94 [Tanacetum coccineum]
MVLTTTPFNGGNFHGWGRNIKMALGAKLKLRFIDGTCVKLAVNDVNYQRCWDELQNLNGLPTCTYGKMIECSCGIVNKFVEMDNSSRLMQFLIKLSDDYEAVISQILGMDPLPNVNKAYYIATYNRKKEVKSSSPNRSEFKKVCKGCNQEGHLVEQCFERIGYPDWYKGKKGKKGTKMATQETLDVHMVGDTPFDIGFKNGIGIGQNGMFNRKLVVVVRSEVLKMFKGKGITYGGTANANQESYSMHYAGIFSCFTSAFALLCHPGMAVILDWISDTWDLDHMSHHLHLFISLKTLKHPIIVNLPDGRTKIVTLVDAHFYLSDLAFQDPSTNLIVAVGKGSKFLYIHKPMLDPATFFYNVSLLCHSPVKSTFPISKGIVHRKFMPYTPWQNGVAERKHKHLLETARAIRFQANLPVKFWGHCHYKKEKSAPEVASNDPDEVPPNDPDEVVGPQKKKATNILRWFPLKPRLQRLFMSSKIASLMNWHQQERKKNGKLRHPADGLAWKNFDERYPEFSSDPRNVRLGIASDGFNPFRTMNVSYSIWPVFVIPYNLPPWYVMKQSNFIISLIIPGPKGTRNKIDVYMRPLIKELEDLWEKGAETFDVATNEMFRLKGVVHSTISDFPGYANLSRWSTKGEYACLVCAFDKSSKWLEHGRKWCYMDHRRWLQHDHCWHKDTKSFDEDENLRYAHAYHSREDILNHLDYIDLMPMKAIGWKTPYEKLHRKVPSYDHLRVIRRLCYVVVPLPHKDKLEPRGLKCVLLGYPPNSKGYTLYDLNIKKVFHSRDVTFKEFFPFKAQLVPSSDNVGVFPTFCSSDGPAEVLLADENIEPQHITNSDATPEHNMPEVVIPTEEVVEPVL